MGWEKGEKKCGLGVFCRVQKIFVFETEDTVTSLCQVKRTRTRARTHARTHALFNNIYHILYFPLREIRVTVLSKEQQPEEQRNPFLPVCAVFSCASFGDF